MSKHMSVIGFFEFALIRFADTTVNGKRFQLLTTLHVSSSAGSPSLEISR